MRKTIWTLLLLAGAARGAQSPPTSEGHLATTVDGERVDVPLKHTEVKIQVAGHLADVTVEQTFHNPFLKKIDAEYLFPLPTGAAVHALELHAGGRVLKGSIKLKAEAKKIYYQARKRGQVAALLTEERPNLFTQSVANLEPGIEVVVRISYTQALEYEQGGYELVFPMVAPPRYVPKSSAVSAEEAAAVQPVVLPPGQRSSHEIGLTVDLEAGISIARLHSPSHQIIERDVNGVNRVTLAPGDTIPNKDFVLRWDVAGTRPQLALLAHRDGESDGSLLLSADPPPGPAADAIAPREMIFVLDTSSSMAGAPLKKGKELIRRALSSLGPDDTFQIVRFDDSASALGPQMIANRPQNVGYALQWLEAIDAAGGTEMVGGLGTALDLQHDPARLRLMVFVTDGFIGNEDEVLAALAARAGEARLFSFGIGSAVNRYLLEELARVGRGAATVIRPDEGIEGAIARFQKRIDRPLLTDLSIDWGGLAVSDVVPQAIPDLFAGQPLVIAAHYRAPGSGIVTVHAMERGKPVSFPISVELPDRAERPQVAALWARSRIAELSRQMIRGERPEQKREIIDLALAHHLLTPYTAFVVVDESRITAGGESEKVRVPVEVPAGLRGDQFSGGGFGMSGTGYGGGGYGAGTIGIGSLGTVGHGAGGFGGSYGGMHVMAAHHAAAPAIVVAAAVIVRGSLDKNILRRVVRAHLNEVKFCYEKAAMMNPSLAGRVVARFVIDGNGSVVHSEIAESELHEPTVEKCIADAVRRWEFPRTENGGIVQVSYPFVLRLNEPSPADKPKPVELDE